MIAGSCCRDVKIGFTSCWDAQRGAKGSFALGLGVWHAYDKSANRAVEKELDLTKSLNN